MEPRTSIRRTGSVGPHRGRIMVIATATLDHSPQLCLLSILTKYDIADPKVIQS
jgi:hypothetical protein